MNWYQLEHRIPHGVKWWTWDYFVTLDEAEFHAKALVERRKLSGLCIEIRIVALRKNEQGFVLQQEGR